MSSEIQYPGQQPSSQPDQAETDGNINEAIVRETNRQPGAPASNLTEGFVRRARLHLFPQSNAAPALSAAVDPSWQQGWVVDSQIVEESLEFGPETHQQQGFLQPESDAGEDTLIVLDGWSDLPIAQTLPSPTL